MAIWANRGDRLVVCGCLSRQLWGDPMILEDDNEASPEAPGLQLLVGLGSALGRESFGHARSQPSLRDKLTEPIEGCLVLGVFDDAHPVDRDSSLGFPLESPHRREAATISNRRKDRRSDRRRVNHAIDALRDDLSNALRG